MHLAGTIIEYWRYMYKCTLNFKKIKFYKDYYYNNNSAYRAVAVLALIIIIAIIHGEGMGSSVTYE